MDIDPSKTAAPQFYRYMIGSITPRPIAWVSTISPRGMPNLAPFSFFNGVSANPPTLVFSPVNRRDGSKKDTVLNLEQTPEFVVNIVSFDQAQPMNTTSQEFPYEVSEFEACGLTTMPAERVRAPRVKEAKVRFECLLHQMLYIGEGPLAANLVIGRIVLMHVDDVVLGPDGLIDPRKLDTIGRMGGDTYARTTDLFELPRPVQKHP